MTKTKNFLFTRIVLIGILLVLLSSGTNIIYTGFDIGGYSTAFEGPKARFYGVEYQSKEYTSSEYWDASLHTFDTTLRVDTDDHGSGKPNIIGEMTSVFLPENSLSFIPSWVPMDWLQNNGLINNPEEIYPWEIAEKMYYMEQYRMKHYISLGVEWDGDEAGNALIGIDNYYENLGIWLEFDLEPTWYIQGGGKAYFALGKVQLGENVIYEAETVEGNRKISRDLVSVSPESRFSPVFIYHEPFGGQSAETNAYHYQDKELNSNYFRDKVYARINLNSFGVESYNDWFSLIRQGDVATFCFDLTVFVIGEWQVQDVQEDPGIYGRFLRVDDSGDIIDFFLSPFGISLLTIGLFIVLLIFFPWVIYLIFAVIYGALVGGKGGKKRR